MLAVFTSTDAVAGDAFVVSKYAALPVPFVFVSRALAEFEVLLICIYAALPVPFVSTSRVLEELLALTFDTTAAVPKPCVFPVNATSVLLALVISKILLGLSRYFLHRHRYLSTFHLLCPRSKLPQVRISVLMIN